MKVDNIKTIPKLHYSLLAVITIILFAAPNADGQTTNPASPANWLFPSGNPSATKYISKKSVDYQDIKANFMVKWSNTSINGDNQPLVGNIIDDVPLDPNFPFAPNEITAIADGRIVVIDAKGKTHGINKSQIPFLKGISMLFDPQKNQQFLDVQNIVSLGLETSAFESRSDSMIYTYIASYNNYFIFNLLDTVELSYKLALDVRQYKKNSLAAIKPVYARKYGRNLLVFCMINNPSPINDSSLKSFTSPPYFRGLTIFNTKDTLLRLPIPVIVDSIRYRAALAPGVGSGQPSVDSIPGSWTAVLMQTYPTDTLLASFPCIGTVTASDKSYLLSFNITKDTIAKDITPTPFNNWLAQDSLKPLMSPYYISLTNNNQAKKFILVAENYKGRDSSAGISKLHLLDDAGNTIPNIGSPVLGGDSHIWSVAMGNVDGISTNTYPPYYPNNPGNEIIVTQSSKDFAYPASRLMILKYQPNSRRAKPYPPNSFLNSFDTIVTLPINGWVAAINDLDGAPDNKDEIVLVDQSILKILRLRNYNTSEFQSGMPFDTLFYHFFANETISGIAVADIEGDGKNDIVVTTQKKTYLVGSPMAKVLAINPKDSSKSLCPCSPITLKWTNFYRNTGNINIRFQSVTKNSLPFDTTFFIEKDYLNDQDNMTYTLAAGSRFIGFSGRFFVENSQKPDLIKDSTNIYTFLAPAIIQENIDTIAGKTYNPGNPVKISGKTICMDSATIYAYYLLNDTSIIQQYSTGIKSDSTFEIQTNIPCENLFSCSSPDVTDKLRISRISEQRFSCDNLVLTDSATLASIKVKPLSIPITYEPSQTCCPDKEFRWFYGDIKYGIQCDDITVSMSLDRGQSFTQLGTVPARLEKFSWQLPTGLPDQIMFRFCCNSSCMRTDTILSGFKPKYINIVAPNPLKPPNEQLEIIYTVPKETNVTIKILDQSDRVVTEIINSQIRLSGINYCERWNGTIWDGSLAQNGMYYLIFETSDGNREVYPVFIKK